MSKSQETTSISIASNYTTKIAKKSDRQKVKDYFLHNQGTASDCLRALNFDMSKRTSVSTAINSYMGKGIIRIVEKIIDPKTNRPAMVYTALPDARLNTEQSAATSNQPQPAMFQDLATNVEDIKSTTTAQIPTTDQVSTEQEEKDWYEQAVEGCKIIHGKSYPRPHYLIKCGGIGSIPRGDIIAVKAKSKNGKSFLTTVFASVILGASFGNIEPTETATRVLYCDTEQNEINVANVERRIYELCEWRGNQDKRLEVFALRKLDLEKRWQFIRKRIEDTKPDAVVVDGIADLIHDFNDIAESRAIVQEIMKASSEFDCAIIFVLHTNKAKDDTNMKGHLGTESVQKCSDVFEVERDKYTGVFNVNESDPRNERFPDFAFILDNNIVPRPTQTTTPPTADEKKCQELISILTPLFEDGRSHSYTSVIGTIQVAKDCEKSNATKLLKFAREKAKILVKNTNGSYSLKV
ncbi:MAG: AAA family ATPase [Prevotella sp.]